MKRFAGRVRRVVGNDGGSALVLALLMVLVVGALLAAVLQFQGAGFALAPQSRDDRNQVNYLQGAVEGAINQIRGSSEHGRTGRPCPQFTPPAVSGLSGATGKTFRVDCTPLASTSTGEDAPRFAIHALGTGTDGIKMTGNNVLYIDGGIYSNGVVTVASQPFNLMRVNGSVNAVGACTGNIKSTDLTGLHCNPPLMAAGDPLYKAALSTQDDLDDLIVPATAPPATVSSLDTLADPVPVCGSDRITFSPGYYGTRPDVLVAKLLPSCSRAIWSFTPGVYYFDYPGDWQIKGYQVIGGTVAAGHTPTTALGKACSSATGGVQFVFGGAGTITSQSASGGTVSGIELCGPPTAATYGGGNQRIVVHGVSGADTATTARQGPVGPQPVHAEPPVGTTADWVAPGNAQKIDGLPATTTATFIQKKTSTLDYTFATTAVPKGADVTKVVLRWSHTLLNASAQATLSSPRMSSPTTLPLTASSCTQTSPCTKDITSSIGSDVTWRAINSLQIAYTAEADADKPKPKGLAAPDPHAATVDGLELEVTYTVPTFRQQTCLSGCTFFTSTANPNAFMHGTVNTPLAGWAVDIHNSGEQIFDRGVIVRTIDITASASSKQTTSPFQLPEGTPGTRYVYFQGYVDGEEKLRACVEYTDSAPLPTGGTAAYYGYRTDVKHWLYMRSPSTEPSSC